MPWDVYIVGSGVYSACLICDMIYNYDDESMSWEMAEICETMHSASREMDD